MRTAAERHLVFFSDCPYYGGAEGYLVLLAAARPTAGWRLSALVPAGEGGEILAARLERAGVAVQRYRLPPIPSRGRLKPLGTLPARLVRGAADWWRLYRRLAALRGDVLHLNLPSVYDGRHSLPAVLAKWAGCGRVVTTEHLPMVRPARRRLGIKRLCSTAIDAIIVHTRWNRAALADYHRMPVAKMAIIPNGSAPAPKMDAQRRRDLRAQLGLEPETVGLVIVGRLTARKGHRLLLEALRRLADELLPPWRLLIVGDGEEEEALRAQSAAAGLEQRVAFLGHREDARLIMAAADLLLLPSTLETQPLVLTEAMAAGRPVVAARIFGIPEIVSDGQTGVLVPPGDVEALATATRRLIEDPRVRAEFGAAGFRRYQEQFRLEVMAERTYRVLSG